MIKTRIANPDADRLVKTGWELGITLEEMRSILWEEGYMVNSFVILKTWTELDDLKNLTEE